MSDRTFKLITIFLVLFVVVIGTVGIRNQQKAEQVCHTKGGVLLTGRGLIACVKADTVIPLN